MIIILNGPLGIGKTTTAWGVVGRFERAVMLDMDYIAAIQPFDYYRQSDLDYAYQTLAILLTHHQAHGYQNFVVNWVFESAAQIERLKSHLAPLELPIHVFRLTCAPDVVEQRIRRRNLPDVEWEVQRARDLISILERAASEGDIGTLIDTTFLTPEAVVDVIWGMSNDI
jgi:broad-specificity NMP kinase